VIYITSKLVSSFNWYIFIFMQPNWFSWWFFTAK